MDKPSKLLLPATIIIACLILGGFYYASQINKQKSIEKQQQIKIEQEKQDQIDKELKEQEDKEEAEQALNDCLFISKFNYSTGWRKECEAQGKLTSECIDINNLSFEEYLKKYNLSIDEYTKQRNITNVGRLGAEDDYIKRSLVECSCSLLANTADSLNEEAIREREECIERFPLK